MFREKLAENSHISRLLLGNIEALGVAYSFSLDVFYNIADVPKISPKELITFSVFSNRIINHKQ